MILPSTTIHVTQKHLPESLKKLTDSKIKQYKKQGLLYAPLADQVGYITGYETIKTGLYCGGYCDYNNGKIAFNGSPLHSTVFHEMAHAFQAEDGLFVKAKPVISDWLKIEWQAETIAYQMFRNLINKKVSFSYFNSYFKLKDVQYLREWYGSSMEYDFEA